MFLEGHQMLSANLGQGRPSVCSLPLQVSQKAAYILVCSPVFADLGDTSRSPSLEASRVYDCGLTGLYITCIL